jgi:hypothetical protein
LRRWLDGHDVALPIAGMIGDSDDGATTSGATWLIGGETPDPYLFRCAVDDMVVCDTRPDASPRGTFLDACWTAVARFQTGFERMRQRERMRVQMGRYGHQNMLGWDEVPLPEFFRLYRDLTELVTKENPIQSATES